jgi:hypothetical protein
MDMRQESKRPGQAVFSEEDRAEHESILKILAGPLPKANLRRLRGLEH